MIEHGIVEHHFSIGDVLFLNVVGSDSESILNGTINAN